MDKTIPSMTVEDQPEEYVVENPFAAEDSCCQIQEAILIPQAVLLSPQDILLEQGFAEVTDVIQESPFDELEETIPLVHASLPPNEDSGVRDNNTHIDIVYHILDRFLSLLLSTDHPHN